MTHAISVAANSLHSFGNFLAANKLSGLLDDRNNLAHQARSEEIIIKSETDSGELLRLEQLIKVLREQHAKGITEFTISKLTNGCRPLRKIEDFLPEMLTRIVHVGGFIEEIGINNRGAKNYKIIKIPTNSNIQRLARSRA